MKKLFTRFKTPRKHGFTLVELLVVIGIIAILAAVTMQIGTTVLNIAKRTKAQNTAQQIQTSVLNYYTEYSIYPSPSGVTTDFGLTDSDGAVGTGVTANSWGPLIECLSGMICPSTGLASSETVFSNSRQIAFLTLKANDVGTGTTYHKDAPLNNLPYSTANPYFNIAVDGDYDGILGVGASAVTTLPNFTVTPFTPAGGGSTTGGVAVWANCNQNNGTSANWYVHTY